MTAGDVWIANQYISGPGSDGGRARIPTLLLGHPGDPLGAPAEAVTNEEKSRVLAQLMFLGKPAGQLAPTNYSYPAPLPLHGNIMEGQVHRHVAKLSPHKAMGMDGIPNVILK